MSIMTTTSPHLPLVTIVTPSLNQARFIEETIQSVLSQDYPNLEYIVIDGGSTDGTLGILKKYENRLRWISEKDSGQSQAINKGFKMAQGEIVAWLNSDDTYLPGAIAKAVDYLVKNPKTMMVYGEGYLIDENGRSKGRFPATEPFNLWRLIYYEDYILQQSVFIRKCILEKPGCLDEGLHYGMDWDLWIRIGKCAPIGYIPDYMANLREYPETKSTSGGMVRFHELVKIMRRHGDRRFPMAYWRYGWQPCQESLIGKLKRLFMKSDLYWLSQTLTWLRKAIFFIYFEKLTRYSYPCQFPDGWISDHVFLSIPAGVQNKLTLTGSTEAVPASLLPMQVCVKLNGRKVIRHSVVHQHKFTLQIPVSPMLNPSQLHELELITNKYFSSPDGPSSRDDRFAFQLLEID
jgi:glycosyltransferase involved in cell wall biosynthesis